ncbi:hypothetical protein C8R45DRAFT_1024200 [Mycena sanguinolenta]|nr:hypothetical protein C8R45DRAFT_1024200 [Mycena sanguinolenta]
MQRTAHPHPPRARARAAAATTAAAQATGADPLILIPIGSSENGENDLRSTPTPTRAHHRPAARGVPKRATRHLQRLVRGMRRAAVRDAGDVMHTEVAAVPNLVAVRITVAPLNTHRRAIRIDGGAYEFALAFGGGVENAANPRIWDFYRSATALSCVILSSIASVIPLRIGVRFGVVRLRGNDRRWDGRWRLDLHLSLDPRECRCLSWFILQPNPTPTPCIFSLAAALSASHNASPPAPGSPIGTKNLCSMSSPTSGSSRRRRAWCYTGRCR